ncbi:MAG: hypothetical protein NUK65_02550 [Firmicutes bacterium]|nr:hypothetical protein [Bacillota bacterium]
MGIGLGLTVASLLIILSSPEEMSHFQIEQKAREMGMVYKNDILIIRDEVNDEGAVSGEPTGSINETTNQSGD